MPEAKDLLQAQADAGIATTDTTFVTPPSIELPKDLAPVANDIQTKSSAKLMTPYDTNKLWDMSDLYDVGADTRAKLTYEAVTPDAYAPLSSGEFTPRFESYLPGINNEEYLARRQSTSDKWLNGMSKFVGKTVTSVLGGTIGTVEGVINGISQMSLSAVYDSDFNNWLDDLNTKMDYKLPNYYTEQEKNMGFLDSVGTANFWANDALGGLSFTVGAIVSEGIWASVTGGSSLIAKGIGGNIARAALKADDLVRASAAGKNLLRSSVRNSVEQTLAKGARISNAISAGNTLRFITTSAGYEAGVEARHYLNETRDIWMSEFEKTNGRTPESHEIAAFEESLTNSANALFGVNTALVGASNFATFGRLVLGKQVVNKASQNYLERTLFGKGYDLLKDGTYKTLTPTRTQNAISRLYSVAKPVVAEGFIEEGGQGVASTTAQEYILGKYSPDATRESLGVMEAFYEGMSNTYGTKEGFKEVGLGMIIGLLGGAGSSIASGQGLFNEIGTQREGLQELVNYRNKTGNKAVVSALIERVKAANNIQRALGKVEQAQRVGDVTGEIMSDQELMVSSIERDIVFQGREEGIKDFAAALDAVDNQQLATELDLEVGEVAAYKEEKLNQYINLSETHNRNMQYAASIMGDVGVAGIDNNTKLELERGIAFSLTMSRRADDIAFNLADNIRETLVEGLGFSNPSVDAVATGDVIRRLGTRQEALSRYEARQKEVINAQTQVDNLSRQLVKLDGNRGEAEQYAQQRAQLSERLLEANENLDRATQDKNAAFQALNVESLSGEDVSVTQEMLDNQLSNVAALKETLKTIEYTRPDLYALTSRLITEYGKAVTHYNNYQKTVRAISDSNTRIDTINGWISGIRNKNKKLSQGAEQYFESILSGYRAADIESGVTTQPQQIQESVNEGNYELTDEVWQKIEESEFVEVPNFVLKNIANKKKQGKELTDREKSIESARQSDIDVLLTDTIEPPAPENPTQTKATTPAEKIKKRIDNIIRGRFSVLYQGENIEEIMKKQPSKKDVDRFSELLAKIPINPQYVLSNPYTPDSGLTEAETEEFQELNTKLNDWKTIQGSTIETGGESVADLLELLNRKNKEESIDDTKTELDTKDYIKLSKATDSQEEGETPLNTIISPDNVLVTRRADDNGVAKYTFSHMDVTTLPSLFEGAQLLYVNKSGVEKQIPNSEEWLRRNAKKEGNIFVLKSGEYSMTITVGPNSRLVVDTATFDQFPASKVAILDFGNSGFKSVHTEVEPGRFVILDGDFGYNTTLVNDTIKFDPDKVYDIENGEILRTVVDSNDVYNTTLLEDYRAKRITKQELLSRVHIYIVPQGSVNEIVGSLRSIGEKQPNNENYNRLYEIRKAAVDALLEGSVTGRVDVGKTVRVEMTLLGNPNIEVVQNEDGTLSPSTIDFTDDAIGEVVDVGYIKNGEIKTRKNLQLQRKESIFVRSVKSEGKVPFVVFNFKGRRIAFPVSLKKIAVERGSVITSILDKNIPDAQKAIQIDDLLVENNLKPSDYNIDITEDGWQNSESVERAINDLNAAVDFVDVETWMEPGYSLNRLKEEAEIAVDITNRPFVGGKTILDLSTVDSSRSVDLVEDEIVTLERDLSGDLIDLERAWRTATNEESGVMYEVFSDAVINYQSIYEQTNPEANIKQRGNINILKSILERPRNYTNEDRAAIAEYGVDRFSQTRDNINRLDKMLKVRENIREEVKNAALKKEIENENTPCNNGSGL